MGINSEAKRLDSEEAFFLQQDRQGGNVGKGEEGKVGEERENEGRVPETGGDAAGHLNGKTGRVGGKEKEDEEG